MRKISGDEISNVTEFSSQGGSWCHLYSASFEGMEVIVKSQRFGSLDLTDPNDDRFAQERLILSKNFPYHVNCYGWGDRWSYGERFLVLEKLEPISRLEAFSVKGLIRAVVCGAYDVYRAGFVWAPNRRHALLDSNGFPKIIDFNDDPPTATSFFDKTSGHHVYRILMSHFGFSQDDIDSELREILIEEYAKLNNVHEPIYFPGFENALRTETEKNDPNYGKLVKPNRSCIDRAGFIKDALAGEIGAGMSAIDIGSNVGYFSFLFESMGFDVLGVDFDADKVNFSISLRDYSGSNTRFVAADVSPEWADNIEPCDLVVALSILHLYFTQHKVDRAYWVKMAKSLMLKARRWFIYETNKGCFASLGVSGHEEMAEFMKGLGLFETVRKIGVSDARRPVWLLGR